MNILKLLLSLFDPSFSPPETKKKTKRQPKEVVADNADRREELQRTLKRDPIGANVQVITPVELPRPIEVAPSTQPLPLLPVLTRPIPAPAVDTTVKSHPSKFVIYEYSVSKPGNEASENQDRFAKKKAGRSIRLTMSDGVSDESYDTGAYANHLCMGFLDRPRGALTKPWLLTKSQSLASEWNTRVSAQVAAVDQTEDFGWLDEMQAPNGGRATLLSVDIGPTNAMGIAQLKAFGVGDTNLFVIRDGKRIKAWPLDHSSSFGGSAPALRSDSPEATAWEIAEPFDVQAGDHVLLLTDALAKYALRREEVKDPIWNTLIGIKSADAFARFVGLARQLGLEPDDTTMQHVIVPGPQGLDPTSGGGN